MLEQLDKPQRALTDSQAWAKVNWPALSVVVVWGTGSVAAKFLLGILSPAGFQMPANVVAS